MLGRQSSWYWRLSALLLLSLCFTYSAVAQPVTTEELVTELTTILTLLQTAQSEYATVSSELARLQSEDLPRLTRQLIDLRDSFDAYRQTVSQEIDRLTMGIYVTGGAALLAILTALIVVIR